MLHSIHGLDQELATVTDPQRQVAIMLDAARKLAGTDIPKALALSEEIIALAGQRGPAAQPLQEQLAECFQLQGTLFLNKADYSAALVSFSKAKTIHEALANAAQAAVELCFIGISQGYAGLYPDALQNLRAALTVFEANDDLTMMANSLNSIGHTYGQFNEHAKGLPFLLRSVQVARATGDKKALSTGLDSLLPGGKESTGAGLDEGDAEDARINVIDLSQLASLREMQQPGHADLVTELIDLFLDETKSHLKVLHEAHLRNDAKEIRRVAHLLKGSSASIGASQMAALYHDLEQKDRTNRDTEVLLARLDQEFELVCAALKAERKETEG